jgi:hypothetical protein
MICYEDTEDPIECSYCKSTEECEHQLAIYDETFDSIEGGIMADNDSIELILTSFFVDLIKLKGFVSPLKLLKNKLLVDLWDEIVWSKEWYLVDGNFDETAFDLPSHNKYMFDKLEEIVSPEYGEFEGGPGQSSSYNVYYTDNPTEAIHKLEQLVSSEIAILRSKF